MSKKKNSVDPSTLYEHFEHGILMNHIGDFDSKM